MKDLLLNIDQDGKSIPDQCIALQIKYPDGGEFIFDNQSWLPLIINLVLLTVYLVPIIFIFRNRRKPSFRTRSPKLIIVGYLLLMLDSISNTLFLTRNPQKYPVWTQKCLLEIFITIVVFYGLMIILFLRMWRVYKVFRLYQTYLKFLN